MLKYLYAQQKSKLIFFVVFSLLSSLFEIALSFVMLQSVNLAMDGNLSDALNDGLWFGLYIFLLFYCRLDLQTFALVSYTGLSNASA